MMTPIQLHELREKVPEDLLTSSDGVLINGVFHEQAMDGLCALINKHFKK